jgi:hypothetical protein
VCVCVCVCAVRTRHNTHSWSGVSEKRKANTQTCSILSFVWPEKRNRICTTRHHHRKTIRNAAKECGNVGGGGTLANLMTDRVIRIEPMIKHVATVCAHDNDTTHDTEWCQQRNTCCAQVRERERERSVRGP